MKQNHSRIAKAIANYIKGTYTAEEKKFLEEWMNEDVKNQALFEQLASSENLTKELLSYNSFDSDKAWHRFESSLTGKIRKFSFSKLWYTAACVIILLSSLTFYFYKSYQSEIREQEVVALVEGKILKDAVGEILPATTGAIIITSSGEKVSLDDSFKINLKGEIVSGQDSAVAAPVLAEESDYYELIVPKAKIIQFTMFDGTKVWVNANSRLKIPTNMANNERKIVLLSGEVYLEVAKYKDSKFYVECESGTVEVLGTKFNVYAYGHRFKTTLVEGSVKLKNANQEKIISPNTAGIWYENEFVVSKANLDADLAWKNNIFYFNNYSIQRIARQIEDWYGVKVIIGEEVAKSRSTYSGELRRDVPLREVRKMLEYISGLDVKIIGEQLNIQ